MVASITAKPSASLRTKNRIREHGPEFTIIRIQQSVGSMGHRPCVLIESTDEWFGWLPLDEVNPFMDCIR